MKKRNLILQSAIAMTLGVTAVGAQAGTFLSAAILFATQNFGPTSSAALGITPATQTYTYNTTGGIVLNPGGVINMYFRLGGGGLYTAVPVLADYSGSVVTGLGLTKTAVVLSTDKKTAVLTLTNGTAGNIVIGVGATLTWIPSAGGVNTVNTILNTVGGVVNLQGAASVLPAAPNSATLPGSAGNPDTGVDNSPSNVVNIAVGASAITPAVTASSAFITPEVKKIDVTVTPSQTLMTATGGNTPGSTVTVDFGSFSFTNVVGVKQPNGTTDYSVAANFTAAGTGAVATGSFPAATPGGMVLTSDAACGVPLAAGSVGAISADKTTVTWAGATTAGSGVPTFVCMTVTGTTVITPTTPALTTSTTPVVATDAKVTGSGTLYALGLNGASVDVRNYIPAGESSSGYRSFVRIVNGGNSSALISVAVIDQTTGAVGPSFPLATLAAGAATTYISSQIEAVTGVIPNGTRPRLRITSPTASLQVVAFFLQPDGNFNDVSGGQLSNPPPAVVPTGN